MSGLRRLSAAEEVCRLEVQFRAVRSEKSRALERGTRGRPQPLTTDQPSYPPHESLSSRARKYEGI